MDGKGKGMDMCVVGVDIRVFVGRDVSLHLLSADHGTQHGYKIDKYLTGE